MKTWAVAAALLTGGLLLVTDAGAQSRRDRTYDDSYDQRTYDQRTYERQYDGTYDRRGVRRDRTDEQEAYERGRRDQDRLDNNRRRDPTLGEQLGDMIDRNTRR